MQAKTASLTVDPTPFGRFIVPMSLLAPWGRGLLPVSPQSQPLALHESPTVRSVVRSTTLYERRRYTEPLDSLKDGREQIACHGHLGQLDRHVLGVADHLRADLDQLLSQRGQRRALNTSRNPATWATESYRLAVTVAYVVPKDGVLGQEYFDGSILVAERQPKKAGVRLAGMLNQTLKSAK